MEPKDAGRHAGNSEEGWQGIRVLLCRKSSSYFEQLNYWRWRSGTAGMYAQGTGPHEAFPPSFVKVVGDNAAFAGSGRITGWLV